MFHRLVSPGHCWRGAGCTRPRRPGAARWVLRCGVLVGRPASHPARPPAGRDFSSSEDFWVFTPPCVSSCLALLYPYSHLQLATCMSATCLLLAAGGARQPRSAAALARRPPPHVYSAASALQRPYLGDGRAVLPLRRLGQPLPFPASCVGLEPARAYCPAPGESGAAGPPPPFWPGLVLTTPSASVYRELSSKNLRTCKALFFEQGPTNTVPVSCNRCKMVWDPQQSLLISRESPGSYRGAPLSEVRLQNCWHTGRGGRDMRRPWVPPERACC